MSDKIFASTVIGYYLGQRLPNNIRMALRGARNLNEVIATITVSPMYASLSGVNEINDAERRLRTIFYSILDEIRSISFGHVRSAVDVIAECHAVRQTLALLGAIKRGIPPEDRTFIIPVNFVTKEAIMATSVEELLKHLPPEYRYKNTFDILRAYRYKALSADVPMGVKRMIERELEIRTILLMIRARINKELTSEVIKVAELVPGFTPELVRRFASAKTWKDALEELSGHWVYEYIQGIENPYEAYFSLHERMPQVIGFYNVPVIPSAERVYSGLKILEWETEKLVSIMNMVVI